MISVSGLVRRVPARRLIACVISTGFAVALSGCVENMAEVDARAPTTSARLAARPGVSPRAATVAVATIEGAPATVVAAFTRKLSTEAASRDIATVDTATAKYFVRGYLSAAPGADGVVIGYVWDVFDGSKARVQRVDDQIAVKGSAADPWTLADDRVLASLASKSADDLAAILSNMPEAVAGGAAMATVASAGPALNSQGSSSFR